jgi:phage FluMu gp28-like protein
MKAALAMMIWGGRVRVLSTHNGEDNAFNVMVRDIERRQAALLAASHRRSARRSTPGSSIA